MAANVYVGGRVSRGGDGRLADAGTSAGPKKGRRSCDRAGGRAARTNHHSGANAGSGAVVTACATSACTLEKKGQMVLRGCVGPTTGRRQVER